MYEKAREVGANTLSFLFTFFYLMRKAEFNFPNTAIL
jgi:hypothetical protein